MLLSLGADPEGERDRRDHSYWFYPLPQVLPAGEALRNHHPEILSLLLAAGASPNAEPSPPDDENLLSLAVGQGDIEAVTLLVNAGARRTTPAGRKILEIARGLGLSNVVSRLRE
jgi:ankyrin repeat protein